MAINRLELKGFTVFEDLQVDFTDGINLFIGENGTGKTHILKVLYSACKFAETKNTHFAEKLSRVFFSPKSISWKSIAINRLVRRGPGNKETQVKVYNNNTNIGLHFTRFSSPKTVRVTNEEKWRIENISTSIFIPAKDVLSHSKDFIANYYVENMDFDETYADIISYAQVNSSSGNDPNKRKKYLKLLEKHLHGKVIVENELFYLKENKQASGGKIEFNLLAEGLRKFGLLWQLMKNGTFEKGSILFWDEPEANINPVAIPDLVDVLLGLQKEGVQIFISTHDYMLAKYFEVKRRKDDKVEFYSLYLTDQGVQYEKNNDFKSLANNPIIESFDKLLDEVYEIGKEE